MQQLLFSQFQQWPFDANAPLQIPSFQTNKSVQLDTKASLASSPSFGKFSGVSISRMPTLMFLPSLVHGYPARRHPSLNPCVSKPENCDSTASAPEITNRISSQ